MRKKDLIDFEVVGPKGDIKYFNSTNECLFNISVTDIGKYTIILNN
jgi:hypothetical protein